MTQRLAGVALVSVLIATSVGAWDSQGIFGDWWTQDHDGVVEIARCASGVCGTVVGVTEFRPDGSPPVDLHGRSRCHLQIIPGGSLDEDGTWHSRITNPDDDKTYTILLRLDDRGRLRMRGYIGIPLLGRTVYWTRFSGHLTPDCHILD